MASPASSDKDDEAVDRINGAMSTWWQGDMTLGEHEFLHLANLDIPLSEMAKILALDADAGVGPIIAETVRGLVVLTQTCDLVRDCRTRVYVEVAPLEQVSLNVLAEIKKGLRPNYAYVPGVADQRLVANLDRTMTIEKSVMWQWQRTPGCNSDQERRDFATALARKRNRWAFPDNFNIMLKRFREQMRKANGKVTSEGRALDSISQIRARAAPSWQDNAISLTFYFVIDSHCPPSALVGQNWRLEEGRISGSS